MSQAGWLNDEQLHCKPRPVTAEQSPSSALHWTWTALSTLATAGLMGMPFIVTHPDYNCPTETGFIPDIAAGVNNRLPDIFVLSGEAQPHLIFDSVRDITALL